MSRQDFSQKVKAAAAKRAGGFCEGCGAKLRYGGFHYDHVVPDGLGGEPTLENCQVLCRPCHDEKTHQEDNPRMRKADRMRKRAENRKATKGRPMPHGRNSSTKRKISGEVVKR